MEAPSQVRRETAPPGYTTPPFPSLHAALKDPAFSLYTVRDIWRFTLLWTLIFFGIFHLGAAGLALLMQTGKTRVSWKYLGLVPLTYGIVAAAEALLSGSIVGLIVGASYVAGKFTMSTWIPFVWGWVNLMVLIVSSFTIQGGL